MVSAVKTTERQRAPRLLVVSGDPERRERWARSLAAEGYRVARCVGPSVTCAILEGARCPLLDEADVALYDRDALVPGLARVLCAPHGYRAAVAVAHREEHGRPASIRRA